MNYTVWKGKYSLIDSWTLMSTPYPLLLVFILYLWIVLKAGPKYMETRKALNLNNVTRIYNFLQVAVCTFLVVNSSQIGLTFNLAWQCVPVPKASDEITQGMMKYYNCYWYFMLFRIFEFLETIFFVLRKKQNQVSFLHVYHHCGVVALLWCFLKYSGSISEGFIGLLNSAVHSIMYSYYFLSSFENLKPFTVKVKHLITTVQIIQLLILLAHCLRAILSCGASKLYFIQIINITFLVFMFSKFYFKNYLRIKNKSKTT